MWHIPGQEPILSAGFPVETIKNQAVNGYVDIYLNIKDNRFTYDHDWWSAGGPGSFPLPPDTHDFGHLMFATLAPIPEPGTYALMAVGLGCVTWVSRRRRVETPYTPEEVKPSSALLASDDRLSGCYKGDPFAAYLTKLGTIHPSVDSDAHGNWRVRSADP